MEGNRMSNTVTDASSSTAAVPEPDHGVDRAAELRRYLSPANVSVLYIYLGGFILFSLWVPDLWLSFATHKSILNISFPIPAIVAVGLVVPLLAGAFDLSIAGVMGASAITSSWLVVNQEWSLPAAILAALVVALLAGVLNGLLVVRVGINSFIATLGTGAVLGAYAEWRSGGIQITGLPDTFKDLSRQEIVFGVQAKFFYLVVIAVIVWYVIEHTPIGRYLQATGDNSDAARLAGVQVSRYTFGALVTSAFVAGIAGVLQTAAVGAGNANIGDPFLLTAFAAAFLGSTQFKGRFNVWGTVLAVWTLLSLVKGVELGLQSYRWLNELFFGVALLAAVGMSRVFARRTARLAARQRQREATGIDPAADAVPGN
jgi:ribose transport system permease protein